MELGGVQTIVKDFGFYSELEASHWNGLDKFELICIFKGSL